MTTTLADRPLVKALKRDVFGRVDLVRLPDGRLAVSRNYGASRPWVRPLARYLAAREKRILEVLAPLEEPGLPRLLHWGDGVLVRSHLEGTSLFERKADDARFFQSAGDLLEKLHERGVAHNDVEKPGNWLQLADGRAGAIDFQLALFSRWRGPIFRMAAREDRRHLAKLKSRHCPGALQEEERALLARLSLFARAWRMVVKPVYRIFTRKVLGVSDRERSLHTR